MTAVPYQKPGYPERHGLTIEQCQEALWTITPDGHRRSAAEATNAALAIAVRSLLPMALYSVPGVGWLQERIYETVARNRHRLPGVTAYCIDYPKECGRATPDR